MMRQTRLSFVLKNNLAREQTWQTLQSHVAEIDEGFVIGMQQSVKTNERFRNLRKLIAPFWLPWSQQNLE